MEQTKFKLILGSQSPRRKELLKASFINYEIYTSSIKEVSDKENVEDFVKDSILARDPIVQSLPNDDEKMRNACVLSIAKAELDRIGLDKASRNKADVRVFLNRISGLMVSRQSLVFSLFMSTLGGVIKTAKTSGEFEGTAEDLAATAIEIGHETDLAVDGLGDDFHAVFIRAPYVERVGPNVEVLAVHDDIPVLARSGRCTVASFHPELTNDTRLHEAFITTL